MKTQPADQVNWKLPRFWQVLVLLLPLVLYFFLQQSNFNPYISSIYDFLHPKSAWAIPDLPLSLLIALVILNFLVAFASFVIYEAFKYNEVRDGQREIIFRWKPGALKWKECYWVVGLFFGTALFNSIGICDLSRFNGHWVSTISVALRCLSIIALVGLILQLFLQDYFKRMWTYLSYFYASIFSLVILAFVLAEIDQMNSIIIDLVHRPINLFFFFFFFLLAIILVWFSPSYLLFTDRFFKENICDFKRYHQGKPSFKIYSQLIFRHKSPVVEQLKNQLEVEPEEVADCEQPNKTDQPFYYSEQRLPNFTIVRRLLGLAQILVLIYLLSKVFVDSLLLPGHWKMILLLISFAIPAYMWWGYYPKKKELNENIWIYLSGLGLLLTASILASVFCQDRWMVTLVLLIITSVFSAVVFAKISHYRTAKYRNENITQKLREYLDRFSKKVTSFMLRTNLWVGIIALCLWLALFLFPLSNICLESVNPINIYLLLVNGLIAMITVIDRYYSIKHKSEVLDGKIKKRYTLYRFWASLVIIMMIAGFFNKRGNSYHEITYLELPENRPNTSFIEANLTLESYTKEFLDSLEADQDTLAPIICIAADGGGLKAAYWTMLVLQRLDTMGLFENNVFLMSGASGGSIGEGIYTYMKAQNLDTAAIASAIQELGETNFLSTDFAGLLGKFPINYFPDLFGIHEWKNSTDRMDAMAQAYFRITNKVSKLNYFALREQPYSRLWAEDLAKNRNFQLPLFILNTARAEDGVKGWAHPFKYDPYFQSGVVDLTRKMFEGDTSFISFPDALFLTNRFPVMSPAGKIEGKGHFVDAGAVENSGLGTIYQVLTKIIAKSDMDSTFSQFLSHPIIVLTVRNARGRYVTDRFEKEVEDHFNRSSFSSELGSFFSSVAQAGITGEPKIWDDIFSKNGEGEAAFSSLEFLKIDLPFPLDRNHPHLVFQRQITKDLSTEIIQINDSITQRFNWNTSGRFNNPIVPPPLGRLVVPPSRKYMDEMLDFGENGKVFEKLENTVKN